MKQLTSMTAVMLSPRARQNLFVFSGFLLMGLAALYLLQAGQEVDLLASQAVDKRVILENVTISGWLGSEEAWRVRAISGWQTRSQEQLVLEGLRNGKIFRKRSLLVTRLNAPTLFLRNLQGDFDVYPSPLNRPGEKAGTIKALALLKMNTPRSKLFHVTTGQLQYRAREQKVYLGSHLQLVHSPTRRLASEQATIDLKKETALFEKNVILVQDEMKITTPLLTIQLNQGTIDSHNSPHIQVAHPRHPLSLAGSFLTSFSHPERVVIGGGITLKQGNREITANQVEMQFPGKHVSLHGNVSLTIQPEKSGEEKTCVFGKQFGYDRNTENFWSQEPFRIVQGDKWIEGNEGRYEQKSETLVMTHQAHVELTRAESLLKPERLRTIKNREVLADLKKPTTLKADRLTLIPKKGYVHAQGHVQVIQKGKNARAKEATYRRETETILLRGDAELEKENGEWVKAKEIWVNVAKQTFEAKSLSEAKILLKRIP